MIFSFARMVGGPYLTYVTLFANVPFLIKVFISINKMSTSIVIKIKSINKIE